VGTQSKRKTAKKRDAVVPGGLPSLAEAGELFLSSQRYHEAGSRADIHFRLTRRITLLARRWRTRLDEHLRSIGQTQARWETLFWISISNGRATQRELAERVGIEGPTLARMLDRLEYEGLVERQTMQNDRRTKTIALKKSAEPLLKEISDMTDALRAELLGDIDRKDLDVCITVIDRMLRKLDRR
jgi:MarR family transcriptional regulator, transcriptional regulator for hemolysin